MARQPDTFVVRILRDGDDRRRVPEGAGVLVRGNRILTCAHVVKSVLRLPPFESKLSVESTDRRDIP
jgi:hypothetical protein